MMSGAQTGLRRTSQNFIKASGHYGIYNGLIRQGHKLATLIKNKETQDYMYLMGSFYVFLGYSTWLLAKRFYMREIIWLFIYTCMLILNWLVYPAV